MSKGIMATVPDSIRYIAGFVLMVNTYTEYLNIKITVILLISKLRYEFFFEYNYLCIAFKHSISTNIIPSDKRSASTPSH